MSQSDTSELSATIGIPEVIVTQVLAELTARSFIEQPDLRRHLVEECIKKFPDICLGTLAATAA